MKKIIILIIIIVSVISYLSSNNFINNDNYFPLSYLFMLEYPDFYNSLSNFLPIINSSFFTDIVLYLGITPLSSTYAPISYIFYPIALLIGDTKGVLLFTLILNIIINSAILIKAYTHLKKTQNSIFIFLILGFIFSIGNLIYVGSNMPYAYVFSSTILIALMAIDENSKISKDILFIILLYLLNYQILFLIPSYFLTKIIILKKSGRIPLIKDVLYSVLLFFIVLSSLLFFKKRAEITGTHKAVGINWNAGVNNEYSFDPTNSLISELFDFINYFPRSIVYHLNENLFEFEYFSLVFWLIFLFIISKMILKKTISNYAIFCISSFIVLFGLVLIQKAVYGPTRHTLIFLPISILLFTSYFNLTRTKKIILILLICILGTPNLLSIYKRKNNFFDKISTLHEIINKNPNSDILLFSCTYQPFLDENFRDKIQNRRVYFFCGNKLQLINSKLKKKQNLLLIDATGQNEAVLTNELNKRLKIGEYKTDDFKIKENLIRLDYNMEQKDYTQLPKQTGLFVWKTINKFQ